MGALAAAAVSALGLSGCDHRPTTAAAAAPASSAAAAHAGALDGERLAQAASEPDQWFTTGRDTSGSYYSPLADIDAGNVTRLGFAWQYSLGTRRGLEATPVVIDGTLYASGNFGRVYAVDAATGKERWTYDPGVDGQWGRYACCDAVNRGVAVWMGRVYVGVLDGRPDRTRPVACPGQPHCHPKDAEIKTNSLVRPRENSQREGRAADDS